MLDFLKSSELKVINFLCAIFLLSWVYTNLWEPFQLETFNLWWVYFFIIVPTLLLRVAAHLPNQGVITAFVVFEALAFALCQKYPDLWVILFLIPYSLGAYWLYLQGGIDDRIKLVIWLVSYGITTAIIFQIAGETFWSHYVYGPAFMLIHPLFYKLSLDLKGFVRPQIRRFTA